MKQVYFKCFILSILSSLCINVLAYDCKVNGVFYNISSYDKTASVTYYSNYLNYNQSAYSGSVTIPSTITYNGITYSVTGITNDAFYACSGLTSIVIPNSVTSIGSSAFYACSGLTSIVIPNSVTKIEGYTFYDCSGLTSIVIPNSVTSIGEKAFEHCSGLTSIVIPNSVISIDNRAFYCNLEAVYSEITDLSAISLHSSAFSGNPNATLYVPHGLAVTYRTTPGWNVFKYIEEMKSEEDLEDYPFLLSCNSKGGVTINDTIEFTNKIGAVDVLEGAENTFVFTPKANCKLEQVCLNGFDITLSVENNTLKAVVPSNSQMIVTFAKEAGDLNNDGKMDISDVVSLVNLILGQ